MYDSVTVRQVLRSKVNGYWGIGPKATAYDALELMASKNIGALLVIDDGKLVGVFSERDYARKVILMGKSSKTTMVEDLMSAPPIFVNPDLTLRDCMVLMTENHVRHLPVMEQGRVMGMVTIGDLVKTIISEQEKAIEQLEGYISGSDYAGRTAA